MFNVLDSSAFVCQRGWKSRGKNRFTAESSFDAPSLLVATVIFGKIVDQSSSTYPGGLSTFCFFAAARTFISFVALMVAHGISTGITMPLRPVLAEQILEKSKASEGVGRLFGILGLAYISGPPLVGEFCARTIIYYIQPFQFTLSDQSLNLRDKNEWWSGYSLEFAYRGR